ncbi:Aste57867_13200 [Aphanomyces stellatus]|uniref:Aste57867_13200 protein n=1 Tax=Aphanomyces stellatus TaxID=120398 RepID=A0A485KXJ0_9STRA|nr:hypothetical protein As57867_013151 [Aphanomyces stellatus]VFT90040.1 Aste57867_13200 [Aphanomyces stellatus]
MSQRKRIIRFEEYAASGPVTEVIEVIEAKTASSKPASRFTAAVSHKDNEAYLAAFDSDPRQPPARTTRRNSQSEASESKSEPVAMPALATSLAKTTVDSCVREAWLRGPSDPAGRADSVSAQPLTCMSLSPDGSEVVVGSCDHALYGISLRKATKGKGGVRTLYSKTCGHGEWVTAVAHLPDGRVVSGGMDSKLCLWDAANRCEDLTGHSGSISLVQTYADNWIVSASYDKTYRLWDGASGKRKTSRERHVLKGHDAAILDFSIFGARLVGGDRSGNVLFFDLTQSTVEKKIKGAHAGHCTAVLGSCHAPERAFSGGQDGILRLWDIRTKGAVLELACHSGAHGTGAVSFIKDTASMEHVVVTGGADAKVQVIDVRAPAAPRATFVDHTTFVYSLHLHHDLCLSGSGSGMLLVHDLRTDALCYGLGANQAAVRAIATTESQLVAAGDDGGVLVYAFP